MERRTFIGYGTYVGNKKLDLVNWISCSWFSGIRLIFSATESSPKNMSFLIRITEDILIETYFIFLQEIT